MILLVEWPARIIVLDLWNKGSWGFCIIPLLYQRSCERIKSRQFTPQRMHLVLLPQQNTTFYDFEVNMGVERQDPAASTFEINGHRVLCYAIITTYT